MLHHVATLVLAVDDHEPAKLPFYIGGGALALWAVLLGFIGLRGGDAFPGNERSARGLMAISVLLVAVAIATALVTS